MSTPRWGDADDSDDEDDRMTSTIDSGKIKIPPTHKSRVDSNGVQVVTSYRLNPGNNKQLLKTINKVKVSVVKVKESRDVEMRRQWKPFGQAAIDEKEGTNPTVHSKDNIYLEDPNADTDLQDEDTTKQLGDNLNEFWNKQKRRAMERQMGVEGAEPGADASNSGWTQVNLSSTPGGVAKYVPPSMRGGAAGAGFKPEQRRDDYNTIRVTNLSDNTKESDLQELFSRYGRITRVYLAKDKETMQSRGFAFVSFVSKDDAAQAMEELQGYGYDHLIMKLEWARPNTPKDPAQSGTQFRSGYGKALAQDTKEKVSYASNLTK